jgi:hypothetical protein
MFVRFRKRGEWGLKVYLAETARRDGKVVQTTIAYLGSIDTRHLGPAPDDQRELASIRARVRFWEAVNPKLKTLVNRLGGDDEVKRHRMAIHARIPWPMALERDRLEELDAKAEGKRWHKTYEYLQGCIEREDKYLARATARASKQKEDLRQEAMRAISQANMWEEEAEKLRQRAR